jgi:hypothetical protein
LECVAGFVGKRMCVRVPCQKVEIKRIIDTSVELFDIDLIDRAPHPGSNLRAGHLKRIAEDLRVGGWKSA